MQQPQFIEYNKSDNKGMDYDFLREEGIALIQKLTGAFWTDFNEHDPGVTILEQLCYAITELSYRAQFDIKDILYNANKSEQSFFRPDQVLPCNALTVNDYRKLLFDSVFEIKNVWLFPVNDQQSKFNGLYNILIDVDETIDSAEKKEAVLEAAISVFNNNRNLGEDIEQISILSAFGIELHAEIDLSGDIAAETVMATVLFKVNEYLNPEVKFYSLEELLDEGLSLNEIFNGPLLKHGFIKTDELPTKMDKILISEVMKIIMQIDGIASVKNLKLIADGKEYENQIELAPQTLPKLIPIDQEGQNHQIFFQKNGIASQSLNNTEVKRAYNEMRSANKRVYRLSEEVIQVPQGQKIDLGNYYSIQHQFPAVYGIGEEGIPNSPNEKRKAQAKQLKGYLLMFEQILANSYAQLENTKSLLSIGGGYHKSYYHQTLDVVPNAKGLFKTKGNNAIGSDSPMTEDYPSNYYEALPKIVEKDKELNNRTLRLLDYLLALHGEEFTLSISQFNYYYGPREFEKYLVKNKTYFLQFLPFINKNRTKGYNYREELTATGNISGIEAKISVLLGLSSFMVEESSSNLIYKKKSLLEPFETKGLQLSYEPIENLQLPEIKSETIEHHFELIDDEEVDLNSLSEKQKDAILAKSIFMKSGKLSAKLLKDGIDFENYRVGQLSEKSKKQTIALYSSSTKKWIELAQYDQNDTAETAVMLHCDLFKSLNIKSESVHLIEHILLRPEVNEEKFGLYILNEKGEKVLYSNKSFSFKERLEIAEKLPEYLKDFNNFSVEINNDKDFEIHLNIAPLSLKFKGVSANESVEASHELLEELFDFLNNKNRHVSMEKKLGFFIQNSKNSPRIPEEFYSFRASVFFPSWTARFSNPEFRSVAEHAVFKEQPASISMGTKWLEIDQAEQLEKFYFKWASLKNIAIRNQEEEKTFQECVDQLSQFIFQFYDMKA